MVIAERGARIDERIGLASTRALLRADPSTTIIALEKRRPRRRCAPPRARSRGLRAMSGTMPAKMATLPAAIWMARNVLNSVSTRRMYGLSLRCGRRLWDRARLGGVKRYRCCTPSGQTMNWPLK